MKDFRPISLCNVIYKIVSKVLANRLKKVLDKCVSEEQSAFVEGRSILHNAMIATEIIHYLKRKTVGRKASLALKIDISKAYDRVDWGFLKGMLTRMGFADKWIHWMMMCVTSVNYSVLVNSDNVGPIEPGRGLRQGDPLSPYLFILVSEGLSSLIKSAVSKGDIHGIQICRGATSVSHLLFADDCFLFCRATLSEVHHIMEILDLYAKAAGQEINMSKSEVFFSRNLSVPAQEDLAKVMGVRHVLGTGIYLGLPSLIGRSKKATFSFVKDRIWKRINSWRGRYLSRAGKETMIKSVLQAIPTYIMSIFLLPDGVVDDIEKMINSFWWGGGSNGKGIRWMSWDNLTVSKEEGGLGFRDFRAFNMAMVAKQGWFIMSNPQALVSRVFKARYFPRTTFFDATLGYNPSFVWRGIWKAREVLMLGCRWSIGDGSKIKVMQEPWLRGTNEGCLSGPQVQGAYNITVKDLLLPNVKQWNMRVIRTLFDVTVTKDILQVPLVEDVMEDRLVWKEEQHGMYSVRSGYRVWRKVRKREAISSWRAAGLYDVIFHRLHSFQDVKSVIFDICCKEDNKLAGRVAVMIENLWKNRNDWVWNNEKEEATKLGWLALHKWQEWFSAQQFRHSERVEENLLQWHPPSSGSFKCNVDAGFNRRLGTTNRGWCIRDDHGDFVVAGAAWDGGTLSTLEAEALALKEAIHGVSTLHLGHVLFESDSQVVVKSLRSTACGNSEFNCIISAIKLLLLDFPHFEVKFVKRQANMYEKETNHSKAKPLDSSTLRKLMCEPCYR
ncbi:uncharacterized protein LOC131657807 [Vicia villosa]|uniref:uncharacterized protein LOC131657807 n=1 Tax=Vicia villosa TaxID=3911 RepID=UPI00273AE5E6|nr:uncharacterized protein LOC131657807 [Vicia villosa]